jgi:hypothetical protein
MVFTVWFLLVMSLLLLARRKDSAHQAAHDLTGDAPPDPLRDGLAGVFVGDGLNVPEYFCEGVEPASELAEGHSIASLTNAFAWLI